MKKTGLTIMHEELAKDPIKKKEHYRKIGERISETRQLNKALKIEKDAIIDMKVESLVPVLLAEKILAAEDGNEEFSPRTLEKFREFVDSTGLSLDQARRKYFRDYTQKTWDKLMVATFKRHYSKIEGLGLDLINSKKEARERLLVNIKDVEKEIKASKGDILAAKRHNKAVKNQEIEEPIMLVPKLPMMLIKMKSELEAKLYSIEMDLAKIMHNTGMVGEKSGVTAIHFHSNVPRGKAQSAVEKALDVTPKDS